MCLSMALGIGFYFRVEKFKFKFFNSNSSGLQIDAKGLIAKAGLQFSTV